MKFWGYFLTFLICACFLASCGEPAIEDFSRESSAATVSFENETSTSDLEESVLPESEASMEESISSAEPEESSLQESDSTQESSDDTVEREYIDYELLETFDPASAVYESTPPPSIHLADLESAIAVILAEELPADIPTEGGYGVYYWYMMSLFRENGCVYDISHETAGAYQGTILSVESESWDSCIRFTFEGVGQIRLHQIKYGYSVDPEADTYADYEAVRFASGTFAEDIEAIAVDNPHFDVVLSRFVKGDGYTAFVILNEDYYLRIHYFSKYLADRDKFIRFVEGIRLSQIDLPET